jgi:tetratricopeptide (TPR) repeat protein
LAEQLISEGDKDKAKAILDKAFEVMPEKNVPFTRVVLPLVESYFQIGDVEKAEQLSLRLFEIFEDDFDFYNSLEPAFAKSLQQDMQMSIMVNGRINQLVNQLMPGSELSKDLQERYKILESNYYAKMNAIEGRRKQPGKF